MPRRAAAVQREPQKPGAFARAFDALAKLISALVLALVCSVLIEWAGMTLGWPDEGVHHSERILAQELLYLDRDFDESVFQMPPAARARRFTASIRELSRYVGLEGFIASPESDPVTRVLQEHLNAMVNVVQTVAVRFTALVFAMPAFVLFGIVGLGEGLMRRDLRRWGGGRESSFLYHHSKRLLGPSMLFAWMLYLASPLNLHPSLVLLPLSIFFSIVVAITIATFKKYL